MSSETLNIQASDIHPEKILHDRQVYHTLYSNMVMLPELGQTWLVPRSIGRSLEIFLIELSSQLSRTNSVTF